LSPSIDHPDCSKLDVASILREPRLLVAETVDLVLAQSTENESAVRRELGLIGTIVMLAPGLGHCVPLSYLERCRQTDRCGEAWRALALIMLHSDNGAGVSEWLQSRWKAGETDDATGALLQDLCQWFPERVDKGVFSAIARRSRFAPEIMACLESLEYREGAEAHPGRVSDMLSSLLGQGARILVVHNIVDGQGDEMIRSYALLQALLDGLPTLEITLFTHRCYLYDHPRVRVIAISETERFAKALKQEWHGIINFFEPYLDSNTYNLAVQSLVQKHVDANMPPFFLWAKKGMNYFVFEKACLNGQEYASTFGVSKRLLPLNYEVTMRLISCLGLPLRVGEGKPQAGPIQTTVSRPDLVRTWENLKEKIGRDRIAIINIFGGQNPSKGFVPISFGRLAQILECLVDEGYGLVIVPNGDGWGGETAIESVISHLKPDARLHAVAAPVLTNAQENMRQLKYFVDWGDTVVTIEGWMMHLAYALGKPFRLLSAPYSYSMEWYPHARSVNQGLWIPPIDRQVRLELALPTYSITELKPQPVHYPEKAMLRAAFDLWATPGHIPAHEDGAACRGDAVRSPDKIEEGITELVVPCRGDAMHRPDGLVEILNYWMRSDDKGIRRWVVNCRGKVDPIRFQNNLLEALGDSSRVVRAGAANALLASEQDLTELLSPEWKNILHAYQLVGEYRFVEAHALGRAALNALQACLSDDDAQVVRDATAVLDSFV